MKILKIDEKLKQIVNNKKILRILFLTAILLLAIVARYFAYNYKSDDYEAFLKPWYDKIIELGKIKSLKYKIGDYNVPYMFILAIFSYIPISPLILIKTLSVIFDVILAIYSSKLVYEFIKSNKNAILISDICFGVILFLPTVFMNSAVWAQCDSIYVTFVIMSLYYLKKDKVLTSFILLGIAFAFKLQFIFILPIYILLYFKRNDISILHFIIIPIVNVLMCLPAIIMGRGIKDCLLIYFSQTGTYKSLTLNYPNLYSLFGEVFQNQSKVLVLLTIAIIGMISFYLVYRKVKINDNVIKIGLMLALITVYFLPRMHERYGFLVEILSIIYVFIYKKDFSLPVILQLSALSGYFMFLGEFDNLFFKLFSVLEFFAIFKFTIETLRTLECDEVKYLKCPKV